MRSVLAVAVTGVLVAGCQMAVFSEVEDRVRETMKDPGSAQFRNWEACGRGTLVSGEVNAKNSYGAYVGFRKFYADFSTTAFEDDPEFIEMLLRCSYEQKGFSEQDATAKAVQEMASDMAKEQAAN